MTKTEFIEEQIKSRVSQIESDMRALDSNFREEIKRKVSQIESDMRMVDSGLR